MTERSVGILGSGDVAKTLGRGFARYGWDVTLGTRSPEKLQEWRDDTEGSIAVGSFEEAAAQGGIVILAVLGEAAMDVIELAGIEQFTDKLLLDTTNPLDFSGGMPPRLLYGGTDSLGEHVQAKVPDARVVKCFNTVSNAQMVDPAFEEGTPPMMICGNDVGAKEQTEQILVEFGWPSALDGGTIESARYLEALVPLWVRVGMAMDTWVHAFKAVK